MKKNSGFTLIEMMVVITIIGVLSSVILVSLKRARDKSIDMAIKAGLANVQSKAGSYFESNNFSYSGLCTHATGSSPSGVQTLMDKTAANLDKDNVAGTNDISFIYSSAGATPTSAVCHDSEDSWAAIISLKSPTEPEAGWCVDSTGAAYESTSLTANTTSCI